MWLTWAAAPNWHISAASRTHTGPPDFRFPASVWVRWRTWPGWVQIGAPGAERLPPPVPRWTWMWSKSTCRSTRWRSSTCTRRQQPPTQWASKRTGIPTRAPGSQVSPVVGGWWLVVVAAYVHLCVMTQLDPGLVAVWQQWTAGRGSIRMSGTVALTHRGRNMKTKVSLLPGPVSIRTSGWVPSYLSLSFQGPLKQRLVVLLMP